MTDRERVERLSIELDVYGKAAANLTPQDRTRLLPDAAKALLALLRERDAAEALAYERAAARCEEMQKSVDDLNETYEKERLPGYCVDPDGRDCAAQIRALATQPNALADHDAKVRAEEREAVAAWLYEASEDALPQVAKLLRHEANGIKRGLHAIRDQAND